MQRGDLLAEMRRKPRHLFLLFMLNRMAKLVEVRLRFSQVILNNGAAGPKKLPVKARFQRGVPHQRRGLLPQSNQLILQPLKKQCCFQGALQW